MGLRNLFEKRSVGSDASAAAWESDFPTLFGGLRTFSGKRLNQRTARNLIAVYAAQSLIADGIATLPLDLFRTMGDQRQSVPGPQAPAWVKRPNPFQTPVDFWTRVVVSLLSDGNAFIATLRNDRGQVVALYALNPTDVQIIPGEYQENRYKVAGDEREFDRSEILHIPAFVVGNEVRGLSPIDVAREAIGLGMTAEEFGARFFAQGVTMSGVIEHPGNPKPSEARLLREMFKKNHAGTKNSHAVGILTGGAAFKPISITPEQAQFLETRRFQKSEIALLYRVPAYLIDPTVTSTWGTGIEEQNKFLVDYTFLPWATRIEQALSTFLLPNGQFVKFNFDARMRPKTRERYEAYSKAIDSGIMSPDEARALEDLPPLPNGQGKHFWRPSNMVPIKTALKPTPTVKATPAEPEPEPTEEENK